MLRMTSGGTREWSGEKRIKGGERPGGRELRQLRLLLPLYLSFSVEGELGGRKGDVVGSDGKQFAGNIKGRV